MTKRKVFAATTSAALIASAVVPMTAFAAETDLKDISKLPSAEQKAINALAEAGIIEGKGDGIFDPYANMTRAEAAAVFSKVAGLDVKKGSTGPFTDVKGHWGADYINAVAAAGIVDGKGDNKFDPEGLIKRAEFSKMVVKVFGLELSDDKDHSFADIAGHWGVNEIEILYSHGLISGKSTTKFAPEENIIRSHAALLTYDTIEYDADKGIEIVEVSPIEDITITVGEEVTLPETVEVLYNNDTTDEVAVEWNTEDVDFTEAGTYEIEGAIEGTDLTAKVTVIVEKAVMTVESISAIHKTVTLDVTSFDYDEEDEDLQATVDFFALNEDGEVDEEATADLEAESDIEEGKVVVDVKSLESGVYSVVVTIGEDEQETTVELDFTNEDAAVKAVNEASTQTQLWNALQNDLFDGVAVQANIVDYFGELTGDYETVAEVIAAVKAINDSIAFESNFEEVVETLNDAYPNEITIYNILNDNFTGVEADNVEEYVSEIYDGSEVAAGLTSMVEIQAVINQVNAKIAVEAAEEVSGNLDTSGNATQAEIDAAQGSHDTAYALVDALDPADASLVADLVSVQGNIDNAQTALDEMNEAIGLAEEALTAHIDAGGAEADEAYENLVAELEKETKDIDAIENKTETLKAATKTFTAVTDAEAAQDAHLAAGGDELDAEYVAVQTLLDTPTTTEDLLTATEALKAATNKLVVYADVIAAETPAEVRELLFEFDHDEYINLSAAQKTDFAAYVLDQLAKEDPIPGNFEELDEAVFDNDGYLDAYLQLIKDVNEAANITKMIDALGALENDAFDALSTADKSDIASNVVDGKPYTTIAEIIEAMGL